YSGISKDELDWILENNSIRKSINKSTDCPENEMDHHLSCSSEYITPSDDNLDLPQSENVMLLPKDQISSRSHRIHKIPLKLLLSRRE
ncbi:4659_t:CDS:2, partial [Racocetra fulgida]